MMNTMCLQVQMRADDGQEMIVRMHDVGFEVILNGRSFYAYNQSIIACDFLTDDSVLCQTHEPNTSFAAV